MQADGSSKQRLTTGQLVGWMPNGGRILVVRGLDGPDGVDPTWSLVRVSTGEVRQLTIDLPLVPGLRPPYDDYDEWSYVSAATLSPTGDQLALILTRVDYGGNDYDYPFGSYFVVRLDGTGLRRVGTVYNPGIGSPGWSPRGRQFVYSVNYEPRFNSLADAVTSIRLDGRLGSAHFSQLCHEDHPVWSPDRAQIAVLASSPYGRGDAAYVSPTLDGSRIMTVGSSTVRYYYSPDWRSLP